jgi:tRNA-Thr(GGU) m(6)t(6)A37 methyltransferase TsaA
MNDIQIKPVGFIERFSANEENKNRNLISRIVFNQELTKALDGINDFSHIYIIFWIDKVNNTEYLHHPGKIQESEPVGVFATRAPIHPNPIGLTLVELVKREANVLWVRGLDAYDGTPVLDIKPYPDWEHGKCIIVEDYTIPKWLTK